MTYLNFLAGPAIGGAIGEGLEQGRQANALALATRAAQSGDYQTLGNALLQLGQVQPALTAFATPEARRRQSLEDERRRQIDELNRRNIESDIRIREAQEKRLGQPQRDIYAERDAAWERFSGGKPRGTPEHQAWVLYGKAPEPSAAFPGQGAEVAGINEMVRTGKITREQAANYLAGKTVTGPGGELNFVTPTDIFPQAPAAAPAPAAPTGNQFGPRDPRYAPSPLQSPVAPTMPAVAAPSVPTAAPSPGVQLRPPKPAELPQKTISDAQTIDRAFTTVDKAISDYKALIGKTGATVLPGGESTQVNTARTNLQLLIKEVANLGALTGPDLDLIQRLIFDPSISPTAPFQSARNIYGAATGTLGAQAATNLEQLRSLLKQRRDAAVKGVPGIQQGDVSGGNQRKTQSGYSYTLEQ